MYLATYAVEGATWLQAAARLFFPDPRRSQSDSRWWQQYRSLVRSLRSVPDSAAALRVRLHSRLEAGLFIVAPATVETELRRAIASFTRLDVVADGELRFARDRREHDQLLAFPSLQCRVSLPPLILGQAWFAFDFRVQPFLHEILAEASAQQRSISYHVNAEPWRANADSCRSAARNALAISMVPGIPDALSRLSNDLADKLRRATYVCEEWVGCDGFESGQWLQDTLERRFRDAYGRYVKPEFSLSESDAEQFSLVATRHRMFAEPLRIDELCGEAITDEEHLDLLSWRPAPTFADLLAPAAGTAEHPEPTRAVDYSGMPEPYGGEDGFTFVSYKREDLERIKPLLRQLGAKGHRVWYDKGIPGGAEWDATIEERVQRCELLLVFISQAAVRSKYVRREVKYADTLGKSVVGVKLESGIDLSDGMAMLLNQYQMISPASPLADEIERALRLARAS